MSECCKVLAIEGGIIIFLGIIAIIIKLIQLADIEQKGGRASK